MAYYPNRNGNEPNPSYVPPASVKRNTLLRICESDNFDVDYDRERGMYRVSVFEDGHFKDEYWFDAYEEKECNLHSKWIGFPNNGVWDLKCDNCHRIIPFGQTPETIHYCPQCGAKMDT